MSEREQAKQIIDMLPEYKISNLLLFLKRMIYIVKSCMRTIWMIQTRKRTKPIHWKNVKRRGGLRMYKIVIKKRAKKFIDKLPRNERIRVIKAIEMLPNGEDIKKLKGHDALLRLRVGEYRIIYTVEHGELVVLVIDAGNRGEIYQRY